MDVQTQLLTEIRDLLLLIAEPHLAERDKRLRTALREIIGKSKVKSAIVQILDGTLTRSEILAKVKVDRSDLSKFIRELVSQELASDDERPRLNLNLPTEFFRSEQ